MRNDAQLYRYVWVITVADPSADIEKDDVAICVFVSEETAKQEYESLMNDEDKEEYVKYFIEYLPMWLDLKVRGA
ncbi:MAG TPA: hypothetical protein VGF75_00595 [Candidatus Saccharimonadales bacterium]